MPSSEATPGRLDRLLALLEADPDNLSLLREVSTVALAERRPDVARDMFERHAAIAPLDETLQAEAGLAAMKLGDHARAVDIFEALHDAHPHDPALRFNLAWSHAGRGDPDAALALLDAATIAHLGEAAALAVQLLHATARFDDAIQEAHAALARHPADPRLLAVTSTLALDLEDEAFARDCALKAGDHPEAQTTLATLALADARNVEAETLFSSVLARDRTAPRAWIGLGLSKLSLGRYADAASDLETGAQLFGDHAGSWIAAGWARLVEGDLAAARRAFETARDVDRTFAEAHGSLAVIEIVEGRSDVGRELAQVARRLDAQSFSAVFANALLAASADRGDAANVMIERAMHTQFGADNRTLAHALARYGLRAPTF